MYVCVLHAFNSTPMIRAYSIPAVKIKIYLHVMFPRFLFLFFFEHNNYGYLIMYSAFACSFLRYFFFVYSFQLIHVMMTRFNSTTFCFINDYIQLQKKKIKIWKVSNYHILVIWHDLQVKWMEWMITKVTHFFFGITKWDVQIIENKRSSLNAML